MFLKIYLEQRESELLIIFLVFIVNNAKRLLNLGLSVVAH